MFREQQHLLAIPSSKDMKAVSMSVLYTLFNDRTELHLPACYNLCILNEK